MGGKTATTTQSVAIPPEVLARYRAVNARAEQVAEQPFQQYGGQFVAPLTGTQQAGIGAIQQAAGAAQPYYEAAAGLTAAGAGQARPGELETQRYMNPFTQNVVEATRRGLEQQQGMQLAEQQAAAIRGGAFGGDRAGIQRAVLQGQQGLATAQAISPLYQRGYEQAVQTAQQQQGVGLQAEQANLQRQLAAGAQFGQLGSGAQQAGLAGAQALLGAGTLEQQTQQADLTARYQQFLQERGYPFQVAQFLANIAMGTGALSGSTTTTTQPAPFFSDEREKTNIKPLGKGLYAYDYIDDVERARETGEPMPPKRVGPMAQDIEKKQPGLVVDVNDYKVVNPAEKAYGGGLAGDSMGGAVVHPGHYAPGGLVAPEDMRAILASQQQFLGPYAGPGGPYGGQQQGKPGYVPQAGLPVPKLVTAGSAPQQPRSGLAEAAQTGSQIAELAKMGSAAYGKGKEWLSSGKPQETSGPRVISQSGATAAGLNAPRESADVAGGLSSAPVRVGELEDVTRNFVASGGLVPRHHYAAGGSMNTAALPYQTEQDYFPEQILETQKIEPLKPAEPPKQQSSGLGEIIGLGAKILPFFLKNGGLVPRQGYQEGGRPSYDDLIVAEAEKRNMPPSLLRALIQRESSGRPEAIGSVGEIGLGQIKPSTARDPGYGVTPVDPRELTRPEVNIPFAADYLSRKAAHMGYKDLNDPENQRQALMLYNAGPQREKYASEVLAMMPGLGAAARPPAVVERAAAPAAKPAGLAGGVDAPRRTGAVPPEEIPIRSPYATLLGGMFGKDMKPETKQALQSENLWIPLLAGVGSMLASKSPYLGGAIGEGLVGGTKAYTDLASQQAQIDESKARTALTGVQASVGSIIRDKENRPLFVVVSDGRGGTQYVPFYKVLDNPDAYNLSPQTRAEVEQMRRNAPSAGTQLPPTTGGATADRTAGAPPPGKVEMRDLPPPGQKPEQAPKTEGEADKPIRAGAVEVEPGQQYRVNVAPGPDTDRYFSGPEFRGVDIKNPDALQNIIRLNPTLDTRAAADQKVAEEIRTRSRATDRNISEMLLLASSINQLDPKALTQPGSSQEKRAAYVKFYNTLVSVAGIPGAQIDEKSNVDATDIIRKIQALGSTTAAQQGGFHAAAIAENIRNNMPSGEMSQDAANKILASMLVELQKDRDFSRYYDAYTRRYGTALNVYDAFNREMSDKYAAEKEKLTKALEGHTIETREGEKVVKKRESAADILRTNPRAARSFDKRYDTPGLARYWGAN